MAKLPGAFLVVLAGLVAGVGVSTAEAGFRTPESLVRNVYAYYGDLQRQKTPPDFVVSVSPMSAISVEAPWVSTRLVEGRAIDRSGELGVEGHASERHLGQRELALDAAVVDDQIEPAELFSRPGGEAPLCSGP